jgi:formate-dependent nitrite reductase membrane component NrfD
MIMALICRFPCWPIPPIFGPEALPTLLAIAGIILSIVMLIDCLKRPASKFYCPLTKEAEYDKLIWAAGILLSLQFYFVGAIVYFFVVWRGKPESS